MDDARRFVLVALDDLHRSSEELTTDFNRQLNALAPTAELHFIQAASVRATALAVGQRDRDRLLIVFRHYDPRGGRQGAR